MHVVIDEADCVIKGLCHVGPCLVRVDHVPRVAPLMYSVIAQILEPHGPEYVVHALAVLHVCDALEARLQGRQPIFDYLKVGDDLDMQLDMRVGRGSRRCIVDEQREFLGRLKVWRFGYLGA